MQAGRVRQVPTRCQRRGLWQEQQEQQEQQKQREEQEEQEEQCAVRVRPTCAGDMKPLHAEDSQSLAVAWYDLAASNSCCMMDCTRSWMSRTWSCGQQEGEVPGKVSKAQRARHAHVGDASTCSRALAGLD